MSDNILTEMGQQDVQNLKVLLSLPSGIVLLPGYLERLGFSFEYQVRYLQQGLLEQVGSGSLKKCNDVITWVGALYALQYEEGLPVHIGAESSLALQGCAHYIRLGNPAVFIFLPPRTNLPRWFTSHQWPSKFRVIKGDISASQEGFTTWKYLDMPIRISMPERAIFECLHLVPRKKMSFDECKYLMEGLCTLRPSVLQKLIDSGMTPKLKRQFLHLAKKERHAWLDRLEI
jgi:hypothetical protein